MVSGHCLDRLAGVAKCPTERSMAHEPFRVMLLECLGLALAPSELARFHLGEADVVEAEPFADLANRRTRFV